MSDVKSMSVSMDYRVSGDDHEVEIGYWDSTGLEGNGVGKSDTFEKSTSMAIKDMLKKQQEKKKLESEKEDKYSEYYGDLVEYVDDLEDYVEELEAQVDALLKENDKLNKPTSKYNSTVKVDPDILKRVSHKHVPQDPYKKINDELNRMFKIFGL